MGTTSEKLTYLSGTKDKLKQVINYTGANITNDTFRSYPEKLYNKLVYSTYNPNVIWQGLPKVLGEDVSNVSLTPTTSAPMSISLKGNTSQYTTTGKNLLNFPLPFSVSGEQNKFITPVPQLTVGQNYYFVGKCSDGTKLSASNCVFIWYDSLTSHAVKQVNANITYTAEDLSSANSFYIYLGSNLAGKTITECMLVKGNYDSSNIPTYEPYTGGSPAPSPSYPYPVNVVSGDNEVDIVGKNLFDIGTDLTSWFATNNNGVRIQSTIDRATATISNNKLTIDSYNNAGYTWISKWIKLNKNTNYIISGNPTQTFKVLGVNSQLTGTDGTLITFISSTTPQTFNSGNYEYWFVSFYPGGTGNYFENLQIEVGNEATTYSPYTSQTYPIYLPVENIFDSNVIQGGRLFSNGNYFNQNNYVSNETPISVVAGETYTLSANGYTPGSSAGFVFFNNGTFVSSSQQNSPTFVVPSGANQVYCDITIGNTAITPDSFSNYQLEKGSKANHFTPYGTPPIELCKTGDYQDYFTKNSGINLINPSSAYTGTSNGISTTYDSNTQALTYSGTASGTFAFLTNKIDISLPAGNYSFLRTKSLGYTTIIRLYKDSVNYQDLTILANTTMRNATISDDIVAYQIYIGNITNGTTYNMTDNFLLAEGVVNNYEPYGTGLWCKYNAIGEVVYDTQTGWGYDSTGGRYYKAISNIVVPPNNDTLGTGYCNIGIITANQTLSTSGKHGLAIHPISMIYITSDVYDNIATTNVVLYYALTTPYLSLITDNTLINQLDNIQNAMSYNDTTNVSQINNDLPILLDINAVKDYGGV